MGLFPMGVQLKFLGDIRSDLVQGPLHLVGACLIFFESVTPYPPVTPDSQVSIQSTQFYSPIDLNPSIVLICYF